MNDRTTARTELRHILTSLVGVDDWYRHVGYARRMRASDKLDGMVRAVTIEDEDAGREQEKEGIPSEGTRETRTELEPYILLSPRTDHSTVVLAVK